MKPLYSNFKRVRRCSCCTTKYKKSMNGTRKHGNTAARQQFKREMFED